MLALLLFKTEQSQAINTFVFLSPSLPVKWCGECLLDRRKWKQSKEYKEGSSQINCGTSAVESTIQTLKIKTHILMWKDVYNKWIKARWRALCMLEFLLCK